MWATTLRKAAAMEQWLMQHRMHYPGPAMELATDNVQSLARCSCGASYELTVVVALSARALAK